MIKERTPEEIKNRLSNIGEAIGNIALEYITELEKENAELKNQVSFLEDNLRVARKDRENLQLKIGKGLQEFIKDCPYTALKFYANEKYVEENTELKNRLKCCQNCKNEGEDYYGNSCCKINKSFWNCDKWEIKENG